jgi:predicted DNA-binding WGR domain protein
MSVRPASHLHCRTKDDLRISRRASLPSYPLSLERYDPAHRIHQYYRLTVQANLSGAWSLLREWGRIGRPSQMQADLYVSLEATQEAFRRKEREKRRRGYQ